MPSEPISFRLDSTVLETVDRLAGERGLTRTGVVKLAIAQLADQTRPPVDRARIEEAIEALRAMKSAPRKAGIGA